MVEKAARTNGNFSSSHTTFFSSSRHSARRRINILCHDSLHEHTHSLTPFHLPPKPTIVHSSFYFCSSFYGARFSAERQFKEINFEEKCMRKSRYFHLLTTSFAILIFTQLPTRLRVKKCFHHKKNVCA